MDFYDKLLEDIENLISENRNEEALKLIDNELSMPYVPSATEEKLKEIRKKIDTKKTLVESVDDDKLLSLLNGDREHQLYGVDVLDKRNLRDYIDVCQDYLVSQGFINAKVLLIDSLIRQEINYEFSIDKEGEILGFNPSKMERLEESESYLEGKHYLEDIFMKEPSKSLLAGKVLFQTMLLNYPVVYSKEETRDLCDEIIEYINKAFETAN
ncbi:MAG: DUF3196 family protein [Erysipelotrichaceae bacterium]|nr:DUF3196 family protein [Erysipelotrichaceae bacterium]